METMDLRPFGRTLVKPNCVASGDYFPHAYTRPEFLEGVLNALKDRAEGPLEELAVGERCGITVPTRFAFNGADYYRMSKRVGGVTLHHFDEVSQTPVPLYHKERLRDVFYTPEPIAKADFFVNCPKFKAHPWTTVTFSMKNYIGIQDDRHRLIDHDHRLNEKVTDLQYIAQPQLIVIDAITAGEGRMLTPIPRDLGLVIMGNNQVAFDAVCCHIIGVDPMTVDHIRMAHERGFGPVSLDEIDILGDVSLEAAQERAQGFEVGLIRVEEYFENSNVMAYGGRPPQGNGYSYDYCWGGCPGAFIEAIEILRMYDQRTDEKMPPLHVVFGEYDRELNVQPGENVIFIGDCATYRGHIAGDFVDLKSVFRDRSQDDPTQATGEDIFLKMWGTNRSMRALKKSNHMRIGGCPFSVAEQVLRVVNLAGLKNPYLDPKEAVPFVSAYLSSKTRSAIKRTLGQPYNLNVPALRGAARPQQSLPGPTDDARLEP